jgi:hypothetical protein
MIDPRDIFNAHRIVGTPNQFRGKRPSQPPMILPQPSVIRSGERRGAALRNVRRAALEQRDTLRQLVVRRIAPAIRKSPRPGTGPRYGFDEIFVRFRPRKGR